MGTSWGSGNLPKRSTKHTCLPETNALDQGSRMQAFRVSSSYQPGRDKIGKTDISENKVWLEQLHAERKLMRLNFCHLCLGQKSDVGYPFRPSTRTFI